MKENKNSKKKNLKKESTPKSLSDINLFDKRVIHLNKEIDSKVAVEVIEQLLKLDSIKEKKDIIMYINSPGGSVSDGMAIYDAMQMVKSDVMTICIGRCASMASVLLSGGTRGKRYITPNSEVMIHEVSTFSMGKIGDVKVNVDHSNTLNERIIRLLANNTGKSKKQIREALKKDKWFNAEEAINYGVIDRILTKNPI